jgi:predicted enzyme related to lactoylglutathione lyase
MSRVTSYTPGTPSWVDLMSSDPDGARRFYTTVFGWEAEVGPPEFGGYTSFKVGGDVVAGLVGQPAAEGMPTAWASYIDSDDSDATIKRITDAGGTVMLGPDDVGQEGRLTVASDPQGGVFGVWEARNHIGAVRVNEPGTVSWNELVTRDLAAAQSFYSSVFGWTWDDLPGTPGFNYSTFKVADRVVGGALEMNEAFPPEIPVHWMVYFAVADADAAADAATAAGGTVAEPPRDSDFGRNALLVDPQGGMFRVIALPEGMAE